MGGEKWCVSRGIESRESNSEQIRPDVGWYEMEVKSRGSSRLEHSGVEARTTHHLS